MLSSINLDEFQPNFPKSPLPPKDKRGRKINLKWPRNAFWVFLNDRRCDERKVGIRPDHLLDWRHLERRQDALRLKSSAAAREFWDTMSAIGDKHGDIDSLFVTGRHLLIRYTPNSMGRGRTCTTEHPDRIVQDLLRSPARASDKFVLVREEDGGSRVGLLEQRQHRAFWAFHLFEAAFKRAVEARLDSFMAKAHATGEDAYYQLRPRATFIIQNEDRTYVVSTGSGNHLIGYTWHEGMVVAAK